MEHGEVQLALLTEVTLVRIKTELKDDHSAGATQLSVYDTGDFRDEGGFLNAFVQPEDEEADPPEEEISYTLAYTEKDDETNILTLSSPLPEDLEADTQIFVEPPTYEKWASVLIDSDDDAVPARIRYGLSTNVEEGIRDESEYESVFVRMEGNDYVVIDFPGKEEIIDWEGGAGVDIPEPGTGPGPGEAPVLEALAGLRSIFLQWTEIPRNPTTNQEVFYEVAVSAFPGFEPSESTLYARVAAPLCQVTTMPDGTDLSTDNPTYCKVRAYDKNGAGPWSNEVSATAIPGFDPALLIELEERMDELEDDLTNLDTVVLPGLQGDLAELDGKFPITSVNISDDAITAPKIIAGAILTSHITVGTLSGDRIAVNTLHAGRIIAQTISANEIATNAVIARTILAGAVSTAKLEALAVTADKVAAGIITADKIATGAITAIKLDAGSVTADKIAAGAITADKLSATAIDGKTITGATFQTNSSGPRVKMDFNGVYVDGNGNSNDTYLFKDGRVRVGDRLNVWGETYLAQTLYMANNINMGGWDINSLGALAGDPIHHWMTGSNGERYVYVNNAGRTSRGASTTSSRRFKVNEVPLHTKVDKQALYDLPLLWYNRNDEEPKDRGAEYGGLFAEHLHERHLTPWVRYDENGEPYKVLYDQLVTGALMLSQDLNERDLKSQRRITKLESQVKDLTQELEELKNRMN